MDLDLTGKRAIVCGSTQGIGKASAFEIAALGANVVLVARNENALKQTLNELDTSKGQQHYYITADFTNPEGLKKSIENFIAENGSIHILVNNTGGPPGGLAIESNPEAFSEAFSMHIICNQILVQAVVDGMKAEKYGRIINIISTSVKVPIPGLGISNTIRGAVASWAKTLANELGIHGITVNNILPGFTNTARLGHLFKNKAEKTGKTVEQIGKEAALQIPLGRIGEAEEIANAVAFLASPAASYISGINLTVDGGRTGCL
ncbi:MAG: short-chain dehydrogenase [Flavobacteriales bacterium]|nr:MAG: short-chain dehydrogenase [Flavobacteriales bacterium]